MFFSTDSETHRVIEAARAFGFCDSCEHIIPFPERDPDMSCLTVCGREHFEKWTSREGLLDALVDMMSAGLGEVLELKQPFPHTWRPISEPMPEGATGPLTVMAIDNLNNVPPDKQERFLKRIVKGVPKAQLLICVAEQQAREAPRSWEYTADICVHMGSSLLEGYLVRTIEIVKARYQNNVWGAHQLKIYSQGIPADDDQPTSLMRRAHPYRSEGGIFIYPSIHYHLSRYKRTSPSPVGTPSATGVDGLDRVLGGGLPSGRCTAFIGDRGGHKSHLGYLHLLHHVNGPKQAGIVISLRDDEQMTKSAMGRILKQEFEDYSAKDRTAIYERLEYLERDDRLEILYFHPGYITPNEFFHRVLMSIYRMKAHEKSEITVLFNSIDQLAARFPLCAKEDIFVPGLIESLSGEGITSVFIAVDESGQPMEQYGLLPMADLILSFRRQPFEFKKYYDHLDRHRGLSKAEGEHKERIHKALKDNEGATVDEVVVQVQRFAGGQRAGKRGILELVDAVEGTFYTKPGLHFTPFT